MTPRYSTTFKAAFALCALVVAYNVVWVLIDLAVKLGFLPGSLLGFDANAFGQSLSIWNDISFYGAFVLFVAALVLLMRRSVASILAFALGLTLTIADWLLLSANVYFQGGLAGTIMLVAAIVAIGLLIRLRDIGEIG